VRIARCSRPALSGRGAISWL